MKRLQFSLLILLFFGASHNLWAQSSDLARIEYTYFPQSSSDNSFRRFKTFFNFPIKVKEGAYLLPGIEYENINFKFEDETPFNKNGELDRYQSFTLSLGYTFAMKDNWRFAAWAGLMAASNFEKNTVINDDLLFTGAIAFIKNRDETQVDKPWRLILGLYYSTKSGRPFPLPVVSYFRKFNPSWSYTIGVPKSNLKYYLNEKSEFQLFATLDGFYANLQEDRHFKNTPEIAESISMTIILAGLGYDFNFTDHLVYYIYAGHTLMNDIRLRNAQKDDVFQINKVNTFYARTGLKFKI